MKVETTILELPFRDPFRIARKMPEHGATTVIGTITTDDGATGVGEGYPDAYYGETPETMEAVVPVLVRAVDEIGAMPATLQAVREWLVGGQLDDLGPDALNFHGWFLVGGRFLQFCNFGCRLSPARCCRRTRAPAASARCRASGRA